MILDCLDDRFKNSALKPFNQQEKHHKTLNSMTLDSNLKKHNCFAIQKKLY